MKKVSDLEDEDKEWGKGWGAWSFQELKELSLDDAGRNDFHKNEMIGMVMMIVTVATA
jgi:hypothetical protein